MMQLSVGEGSGGFLPKFLLVSNSFTSSIVSINLCFAPKKLVSKFFVVENSRNFFHQNAEISPEKRNVFQRCDRKSNS